MSFIRQHKGAVVWSVALHLVAAAAVVIGLPWRMERPPALAVVAAPIQGTIVDTAAIEREKQKREDAARAERQRQQRAEQQRRQAAEQQRLNEQRVADERRARDEAQRAAADKAEQQRRDEQAKAERDAQARRDKEEADKRAREQAEARRRQQAEAELAAQVAAEAEANAARAAGLQDQYMLMIENHVKRRWEKPLSARAGIECVANVTQALTGDVLSVTIGRCNGDDAMRRSVEDAVRRASPLPRPPTQAVFSRTFTLTFAPDE